MIWGYEKVPFFTIDWIFILRVKFQNFPTRFTLVLISLSWLLQKVVFPEQKHSVHPSGFICCRSNVPSVHVSHFSPSTLGLHKHSAFSWNSQDVSKSFLKICYVKGLYRFWSLYVTGKTTISPYDYYLLST